MARRYEFYVLVARYCSCHKKKKFISSSKRVMFFLSFFIYKHTDDGVFVDFPTTFGRFLKISQDFPNLFWRPPDERSRTFSENFRKFSKMSEDVRRLSSKTRRCFDDTPTNNISKIIDIFTCTRGCHIFTCEDIVSFLTICYHPVYNWPLYNKSTY